MNCYCPFLCPSSKLLCTTYQRLFPDKTWFTATFCHTKIENMVNRNLSFFWDTPGHKSTTLTEIVEVCLFSIWMWKVWKLCECNDLSVVNRVWTYCSPISELQIFIYEDSYIGHPRPRIMCRKIINFLKCSKWLFNENHTEGLFRI